MRLPRITIPLIFLLFGSNHVFAQDSGKLILGTVENLPPFSFLESNELKGIDIDIVNELAKRINMKVEIRPMPWSRVIAELKTGTIDGAFSVYENEERKEYILYLGIIHFDNLGIFAKNNRSFVYNDVRSLYGKRVGKGLGVFISKEFDDAAAKNLFYLEEINDTNMSNIRKLYLDRLDAVIGVIETMQAYSRYLGYENEMGPIMNYIDTGRPGFLVLSKRSMFSRDHKFMNQIKREVENIMNDGTYERLKEKYYIK